MIRATVPMHPAFAIKHYLARAEAAAIARNYEDAQMYLSRANRVSEEVCATDVGLFDAIIGLCDQVIAAQHAIDDKRHAELAARRSYARSARVG